MRSELIFSASERIDNRFLLATIVMRAVRKLHIESTRTEDTANQVLSDVAEGRYTRVQLPVVVPPPAIEPLLIGAVA
jgi:hypothetical protein